MAADNDSSVDADVTTDVETANGKKNIFSTLFTNAWFQVLLISFICFCCPGVSLSLHLCPSFRHRIGTDKL